MTNFIERTVIADHGGLAEYEALMIYSQLPTTEVHEFLPTYQAATTSRPWNLIAPYITDTNDLLSASLVSKDFHRAFMPQLWGAPGEHFGQDIGERYLALRHFLRCVEIADIRTRILVHTLSLFKFQNDSRILDLHDHWLPVVSHVLPNLQVVQVRSLQHMTQRKVLGSLLELSDRLHKIPSFESPLKFGLRMLILRDLRDVTPLALGKALALLPNLIFLDLTETRVASRLPVINVISDKRHLPHLQILKLRNVGLHNQGFYTILVGRGCSVWSLDVRNNYLHDDTCLGGFLRHCFMPAWEAPPSYQSLSTEDSTVTADALLEMLPLNDRSRFSHTDHRLKNTMRVDTEEYVRSMVGRHPAINLGPEIVRGLTHLYTANNKFSVKSIRAFLEKGRLRVFDAGTILPEKFVDNPRPVEAGCNTWTAAASDFWNHLNRVSNGSLCCLRINHHLITGDAELFDDGLKPGKRLKASLWPIFTWNGILHAGKSTYHWPKLIHELIGIRVLIQSDIPTYSHRGWITRILIDFIECLASTPNSIERLYLELSTDSLATAPPPRVFDEGPSRRKLASGRYMATGDDRENPYIGGVRAVVNSYLKSNRKWHGSVEIFNSREECWGPSSRCRAEVETPWSKSESAEVVDVGDDVDEHKVKRTRWSHIPWGEREEEVEVKKETTGEDGGGSGETQAGSLVEWGRASFQVFEDGTAGP